MKTRKRIIAMLLAVLSVLPLVSLPAAAAEGFDDKIVVEIRSDIAGLTEVDYAQMLTVRSNNIAFDDSTPFAVICLSDYAGDVYFDELKPGRTYTMNFAVRPIEGYTLPDELNEQNTEIICGKNVNVFWYGVTGSTTGDGTKYSFASFWAEITVDGNWFQMLIGRILDIFLKIRAWSPY